MFCPALIRGSNKWFVQKETTLDVLSARAKHILRKKDMNKVIFSLDSLYAQSPLGQILAVIL